MMANTEPNVLLLGIGNVLWADEGFGVRVVEHLQKHYRFPAQVRVLDGGTQGVYLIDYVQSADVLVIFDAVDYGLPPASLKLIKNNDVPSFLGAKKMSLHQTGFQEVLAMAQMLGRCPEQLLLIGVQPMELDDYGGSLRSEVKAQIQPAIEAALAYLQTWGIQAERLASASALADPALDIARYEQERPSQVEACRDGDARVLKCAQFKPKPPQFGVQGIEVDVDYRGKY